MPFLLLVNESQNVLGEVIGFKVRPAVKEGEDATISNQGLLLYKDPIKLLDIVNIVGRFQTWVTVPSQVPPTPFLFRRFCRSFGRT